MLRREALSVTDKDPFLPEPHNDIPRSGVFAPQGSDNLSHSELHARLLPCPGGKDLRFISCDENRPFKVRRIVTIRRQHDPIVGSGYDVFGAGHNHRLDCERHSGLQRDSPAGMAIVRHLRRFMETPSYAVSCIIPNETEPFAENVGLDCVSEITDGVSRSCRRYGPVEPVLCRTEKVHSFLADIADGKGACSISIIPFVTGSNIDAHDIAVFQKPVAAGYSMYDLAVDRNTNRTGKGNRYAGNPVPLECGGCVSVTYDFLRYGIDKRRRYAGSYDAPYSVENIRDDFPGATHVLNIPFTFKADHDLFAHNDSIAFMTFPLDAFASTARRIPFSL